MISTKVIANSRSSDPDIQIFMSWLKAGRASGLETNAFQTPLGGYSVKFLAGENLSKGNIVCIPQNGSGELIYRTPGNAGANPPYSAAREENDMPIGVVFEDAVSGGDVWVVVSGVAEALPMTTVTAAKGNIAYASSTELGRLNQAASAATAQHWREVGHWLATGTGNGVLAKIIIHFN
jgi:hypothetical protein